MVELTDGSVIAQIGTTDMRLPIQYAFSYPQRWDAPVPVLDLTKCAPLEFHEPAWDDFPCLGLAYRALEAERSLPIVLNAANEVAVSSFLQGRLSFPGIARVIESTMNAHHPAPAQTLDAIREVDRWARDYASTLVASSEGRAGEPSATAR
jgi:1-deoxy-D-xylulose-5-phosphate reductoisomerase